MAVCFLDSWEVADDIGCARASRILCYFCVKLVNALFTGSKMKRTISPTRNLHFFGFFTARNCLVFTFFQPLCSQQRFNFFQEPFRTWILQGWSPAPHELILSHGWVQSAKWNAHALCTSKPCELARNLSKTSRTGPTSGYRQCWRRLETTWDLLTWNSSLDEPHFAQGCHGFALLLSKLRCHQDKWSSSHEREYIPQPTATA